MVFDWPFFISQIPALWEGMRLTLALTGVALLLGVAGGLVGGTIRTREHGWLNRGVFWYVEVVRNTPLAVQLFFLYFGLPDIGVKLSGFTAAVFALALWGSAYATENFRSGFEAVPRDVLNAARALGLSSMDVFLRVQLPIGLRIALPSLGNTAILILKDSSVAYLISVQELTYTAINILNVTFRVFEMFVALGVGYLGAVLVLSYAIRLYERSLRIATTVSAA